MRMKSELSKSPQSPPKRQRMRGKETEKTGSECNRKQKRYEQTMSYRQLSSDNEQCFVNTDVLKLSLLPIMRLIM